VCGKDNTPRCSPPTTPGNCVQAVNAASQCLISAGLDFANYAAYFAPNDPTANTIVSTNCVALVGAAVCDAQCLAWELPPATLYSSYFDCSQNPPVLYPYIKSSGCTSCYVPEPEPEDKVLSPGAIAGITIACFAGVGLFATGIFMCGRRRKPADYMESYLLSPQ